MTPELLLPYTKLPSPVKDISSIRIGTSGFQYGHWENGVFYPEKSDINFYQQFFNTVELKSPFYIMPKRISFVNWREKAPEGFKYSVKVNQQTTYKKKLSEPHDSFLEFMDRASELRETAGVFLLQFPESFAINIEKLDSFLEKCDKSFSYTTEFLNNSWYESEEVKEVLTKHNVAFCISHINYNMSPIWVTSNIVYIRLHGSKSAYVGKYTNMEIYKWSVFIKEQYDLGKIVYCYFDNDTNAQAPKDAIHLLENVCDRIGY